MAVIIDSIGDAKHSEVRSPLRVLWIGRHFVLAGFVLGTILAGSTVIGIFTNQYSYEVPLTSVSDPSSKVALEIAGELNEILSAGFGAESEALGVANGVTSALRIIQSKRQSADQLESSTGLSLAFESSAHSVEVKVIRDLIAGLSKRLQDIKAEKSAFLRRKRTADLQVLGRNTQVAAQEAADAESQFRSEQGRVEAAIEQLVPNLQRFVGNSAGGFEGAKISIMDSPTLDRSFEGSFSSLSTARRLDYFMIRLASLAESDASLAGSISANMATLGGLRVRLLRAFATYYPFRQTLAIAVQKEVELLGSDLLTSDAMTVPNLEPLVGSKKATIEGVKIPTWSPTNASKVLAGGLVGALFVITAMQIYFALRERGA